MQGCGRLRQSRASLVCDSITDEPGADRKGFVLQGEYVLLEPLAEGGGALRRATQLRTQKAVVVRFFRGPAENARERLHEQLGIASRIRHPALAAWRRSVFCPMARTTSLLAGRRRDARALGGRVGIPPLTSAVELLHRVCVGLNAMHRNGLAHDALSPRNVFVTHDDSGSAPRVDGKLVDVGRAAFLRAWPPRLPAAQFMAPEQLALALARQADYGAREADARMNVYSCGSLLYDLCTGGAPVQAPSLEELARGTARQPAAAVEDQPADLRGARRGDPARARVRSRAALRSVSELAAALLRVRPARNASASARSRRSPDGDLRCRAIGARPWDAGLRRSASHVGVPRAEHAPLPPPAVDPPLEPAWPRRRPSGRARRSDRSADRCRSRRRNRPGRRRSCGAAWSRRLRGPIAMLLEPRAADERVAPEAMSRGDHTADRGAAPYRRDRPERTRVPFGSALGGLHDGAARSASRVYSPLRAPAAPEHGGGTAGGGRAGPQPTAPRATRLRRTRRTMLAATRVVVDHHVLVDDRERNPVAANRERAERAGPRPARRSGAELAPRPAAPRSAVRSAAARARSSSRRHPRPRKPSRAAGEQVAREAARETAPRDTTDADRASRSRNATSQAEAPAAASPVNDPRWAPPAGRWRETGRRGRPRRARGGSPRGSCAAYGRTARREGRDPRTRGARVARDLGGAARDPACRGAATACYAQAARAAGRTGFGELAVEVELDERGACPCAARQGRGLPGLDRCVADAAGASRRVRRTPAP